MKSTGESILFIDDLKDDQFYALYSRRKMYLSKLLGAVYYGNFFCFTITLYSPIH